MYQEPKKLAELQSGVRNFCGDFNARKKYLNRSDAHNKGIFSLLSVMI